MNIKDLKRKKDVVRRISWAQQQSVRVSRND